MSTPVKSRLLHFINAESVNGGPATEVEFMVGAREIHVIYVLPYHLQVL